MADKYVAYLDVKEPCKEGARKCIGYDLYECIDGKWQLIEKNSSECGYTVCPIACVSIGTELANNLSPFYALRDKLKSTKPGEKLVNAYYSLSPFVSPLLLKHVTLRKLLYPPLKALALLLNKKTRKE